MQDTSLSGMRILPGVRIPTTLSGSISRILAINSVSLVFEGADARMKWAEILNLKVLSTDAKFRELFGNFMMKMRLGPPDLSSSNDAQYSRNIRLHNTCTDILRNFGEVADKLSNLINPAMHKAVSDILKDAKNWSGEIATRIREGVKGDPMGILNLHSRLNNNVDLKYYRVLTSQGGTKIADLALIFPESVDGQAAFEAHMDKIRDTDHGGTRKALKMMVAASVELGNISPEEKALADKYANGTTSYEEWEGGFRDLDGNTGKARYMAYCTAIESPDRLDTVRKFLVAIQHYGYDFRRFPQSLRELLKQSRAERRMLDSKDYGDRNSSSSRKRPAAPSGVPSAKRSRPF